MIVKYILLVFYLTGSPQVPYEMLMPKIFGDAKSCSQEAKRYAQDDEIASAGCVEVQLPAKENEI